MTRTLPLPPLQMEATAGLATDFGIIHLTPLNGNGSPSRRVLVVPRCRTVVSIQTAAAG